MADKVVKSDAEWQVELTPEQFAVCRQKATERPFTGEYYHCKEPGLYRCAACGNPLFSSDTKYESGSGWPSFYQPVEPGAVRETMDESHGMRRTEAQCSQCDSHLGHVFPDGPVPTGQRYCINSLSLRLDKKAED